MEATEAFGLTYPRLHRIIDFRARKWRIPPEVRDEVLQLACLVLWQACLRHGTSKELSAHIIATAAWEHYRRQWVRSPKMESIDALTEIGAEPMVQSPEIHVDGVRMTIQEARLDHPEAFNVAVNGIDVMELAQRRGVSRQAILQQAPRLGGIRVDGKWRFPRGNGEIVPARRRHPIRRNIGS